MKTKTLVSLIFACAACAQAATYTSEWSVFDSGLAQGQSGAVTNIGVVGAWSTPILPAVEPTPTPPLLTISLVGNNVRVSWPAWAMGFELQERTDLSGGSWITILGPYQSDAMGLFILAPATQGSRYYRLRSL